MRLPGINLFAYLREYWRQLLLPECPLCSSPNIKPSRLHWWERALLWLGLLPYRCGHCLRRSYLRARAPRPWE